MDNDAGTCMATASPQSCDGGKWRGGRIRGHSPKKLDPPLRNASIIRLLVSKRDVHTRSNHTRLYTSEENIQT